MRTRLLTFKSLLLICVLAIVGGAQAWAQTYTYKLVDDGEIIDGGVYILANTFSYTSKKQTFTVQRAMGEAVTKKSNRKAVAVTIAEDNTITTSAVNLTEYPYEVVAIKVEGGYKFKLSNGKYLANRRAIVGGKTKNYLVEDDVDADGVIFSAVFNSKDKTFTFSNTYSGVESILQFNINSSTQLVSCYGENSNMKDSQLYRKVASFSISSAGYATYFTDKAFTMPEGVTGNIITANNGNNILTIEDKYPAGSVVPASTALLLKGAEKEYTCNVVTTTETAPANNLLHGTTTDEETNAGEGTYKYYKLSYDDNDANLGFYWGAENGAAFTNKAGKAYLAVPVTEGQSMAKGFSLSDLANGTTTSIQQASIADKAVPIFDINGRRVSTLNGAAKGVYIVGGKKVMVK
ncbi:MAG: hypothetical protein U0J92_01825 [Prevotellamassilia sp.]|nr:hypothetical protein [Prevotellamassilia sp.]